MRRRHARGVRPYAGSPRRNGDALAGDAVRSDHVGTAACEHGQHARFLIRSGIGHDGLHHKAVHLGFGQVERAFFLDGVLGGDDHERLGQGYALAANSGRAFRHRLKHGGLGLGVGAVDFVQQHKIGVNGADLCGEFLRGKIEYLSAHQIGRHKIRRALYALERAGYACGKRLCRGGLSQAGHGFDKNMAARHQRHDQRLTKIVLSDQRLGKACADAVCQARARLASSAPSGAAALGVGTAAGRAAAGFGGMFGCVGNKVMPTTLTTHADGGGITDSNPRARHPC